MGTGSPGLVALHKSHTSPARQAGISSSFLSPCRGGEAGRTPQDTKLPMQRWGQSPAEVSGEGKLVTGKAMDSARSRRAGTDPGTDLQVQECRAPTRAEAGGGRGGGGLAKGGIGGEQGTGAGGTGDGGGCAATYTFWWSLMRFRRTLICKKKTVSSEGW